jgi:signal transduction histidine kinase
MKPLQFYVLIIIGAGCLILSIVGMTVAKSNQHLQVELQQQQDEINRGNQSQQMRNTLVHDIAEAAAKNKDNTLRDILTRAGFTLTLTSPSPSPGETSSGPSSLNTPSSRP